MADIKTDFLGLELSSPVIIGSSGLTGKTASIVRLAEAGAGAVVLKSLFEEQILAGAAREAGKGGLIYGQGEIDDYIAFYERKHSINDYLDLIRETKKAVSIPVIASINAASDKEWQAISSDLEKAGADALQLNLFINPFDIGVSGADIEESYVSVVRKVKALTSMPLAVKIGPYFSNTGHLVSRLADAGAEAVVLFNRYASPDIDSENMKLKTASSRSMENEYSVSLRWTALLSSHINTDLAAATGIHDGSAVVKLILAGARAVEIVSAVYEGGEAVITGMNDSLSRWMEKHSHSSISDFLGKMSSEKTGDSRGYERIQYMKTFGDI
jgi:dihydroorotate dehydrogenase (fumarate)